MEWNCLWQTLQVSQMMTAVNECTGACHSVDPWGLAPCVSFDGTVLVAGG